MKNDPYRPKPYVELEHPSWSKKATIYGMMKAVNFISIVKCLV